MDRNQDDEASRTRKTQKADTDGLSSQNPIKMPLNESVEKDIKHNGHQEEVLITTDGSQYSQIAAILACQIAELQRLRVKGLYIVDEHYILDNYSNPKVELGEIDLPSSRADLVDLFKERGELALKSVKTLCRLMNVPFQYEIVFGSVADEIVRQSQQVKLVAFGRKGFQRPGEMSHLGENVRQFIHRIPVPFIVGGSELRSVRNILLGFNGSIAAARALRWAELISGAFQANTYVSYVIENDQAVENVKDLEKVVRASRLKNYEWVPQRGNPINQFSRAVIDYDIDLFILGHGEHNMITNLVKGNTFERLLCDSQVTTLVG